MKNTYILFVVLLISSLGFGQTTIYTQDFETADDGYTASATEGSGDQDVFNRTNPNLGGNSTFIWAVEDTGVTPATLTLDQIDVTGYTDFTFSIDMIAHHFEDWDSTDELLITYSIDSGASQNLMWVQMVPDDTFNGPAALDTDFDGEGDCGALTTLPALTTGTQHGCTVSASTFATFSSSTIALSSNSTLDITLTFNGLTSGDEGIYLDNIEVEANGGGGSCTAPTTQASAYNTTGIGTTGATLNWTSGDGDEVLVVVKEGTAVDSDPTNGTSYTSNTVFGSGDEIGTGNYVVYSGTTTNSVSISGLDPLTTYHVAVYEYNTLDSCYLTPALTGNFTTDDCAVPEDVAFFTATANNASVDLSWTNGSCLDEVLVVARAASAVSVTPTGDGSAYSADAAFGSGTDLGTGEYAVYKGTGTSITVTGLTNGTEYFFTAFVRKGTSWTTGMSDSATPVAPALGWQITAEDTSFVIDFDTTVSGVNEGTFDGSGFTSTPVSGQLDSDAWESTGMSDGALSYGGSATSGDYARGTSSGGVTSGGFYAFDTGAGNNTLGFQGTTGDFTPGTITLRAQNQTGNTVTTADLAYLIYVFNDQGRSNTMNFSYSTDDVTYTDVSAMDFTSEEIADGVPAWSSNPRSTSITGLSIADGGYLYLRWSSDDDSGSGSRDELALDDIDLTFNPSVGGTTYTFTGTWAPSDPNGTATAGDDIVIASGNATINTNTTCNSVTVNPGAGLTVDTGVTLTTSNGLALESTSTTYSSLILDGFVVGTLTYDRHVNINGSGETGSNDLISAPLTGQSFDDFQNANPNILSNTGATLFLFGPFDKTIGNYVTYADGETATLDPGVGYRAASNDNSTFTFTGTANNGNIDIDIQNAGPDEAEWNLIGNPYPSYLNVQDFLNHDVGGVTNLQLFNAPTAAIYGYDGSAQNGWTIYNLATTTPTTVIAPGQGFFVSADSTNDDLYDLQFTPAMRSTGTTDDFIVGRTAPLTHFTVNLSSLNNTNKTEFYFNSAASEGFDLGYDAKLWGDTNTNLGIYSHLVQNNAGIAMALQTLNDSNLTGVTIPLGVNASNGEQIRFTISESTLPESVNVYLEDTVKNTITLLNTGDYVFTPSATISGTGRFFLRISENALSSVEDNLDTISIYALQNSKELVVTGQLEDSAYIELFDIQGRKVLTTTLDSRALENRIDVSALTVGVYVAAVQNNGHQKSQKVIIK